VQNPGNFQPAKRTRIRISLLSVVRPGALLILLLLSTFAFAQQQRVEAMLSSQRVSVDESVILNIRAVGLDAELDYSDLLSEFDVINRSSSRQVSIENGKRTSIVEWMLELTPRRTGALTVAPVRVGSEQSLPQTLLVVPAPSGSRRDLFLEATVDNAEPYVQSQVIYTVRVFQDVRFLDASLSAPQLPNATIEQLGEERTSQEAVDGRLYDVTEIRYTLFPTESGEIKIPSVVLKAAVLVDRNQQPNTRTRTRRLTRRADEVTINVKPRPDSTSGTWWLPAKEVKLQSEWSMPPDQVKVDQPVTRTVYLMAQGVSDAQLPDIAVPKVDNLSIYADSPVAATNASENGMLAQQTNTWAVIPQVPGEHVLPEIRVNWFDIKTGEPKVAVLPEEVITVAALAGGNAGQNTSGVNGTVRNNAAGAGVNQTNTNDDASLARGAGTQSENNSTTASGSDNTVLPGVSDSLVMNQLTQSAMRWRMIAFALLVGWCLSFFGLWLWWKNRSAAEQLAKRDVQGVESATDRFRRRAGSRASLSTIESACQGDNAKVIADAVMGWGVSVWPDEPPTHFLNVAERLNSPNLMTALKSIDAAQFKPDGSVNSVAVESIPKLMRQAIKRHVEPDKQSAEKNLLPAL